LRFGDFLKATVLLSGASATLLAALTIITLANDLDEQVAYLCAIWWLGSVLIGLFIGRGAHASPAISRLLASARSQTMLPELHPSRTLANRLWPLLLVTFGAAALSLLAPQIPAIATGFAIIWSLAWRRQEGAVAAIEERDGVRFYVDRTSPLAAIQLVRTPGFGGDFIRQTI
jgi:hypothetical protein